MSSYFPIKKLYNRVFFLRNKDFREIKTSFCFLDETGFLNSPKDKYFAIGILKCEKPELLYNKIRKIRQKYNYNEEIKWHKLDTPVRFQIAMEIFKIFLNEDVQFNCIILDKTKLNFEKYFNGDLYKVYTNFSITLMKLVIGNNPNEILMVLADDYFSPDGKDIEAKIKKFTNDHYKDFVIAGVCQIDSKSSDLLQLTDLILGSIVYDLKRSSGILTGGRSSYKRKFLNFLYQKLEIKESIFIDKGFRKNNYIFSNNKLRATIFNHKQSRNKYLDK